MQSGPGARPGGGQIVQSGIAAAVVDGLEHVAPAGTNVRLIPSRRTIVDVGDEPARGLIVSAFRSSG